MNGLTGVNSSLEEYQAMQTQRMNTKTENGTNLKQSDTANNDASIAKGGPAPDFLVHQYLPRSGLKLVRCLLKEWSVTTAKVVFDETRLAPTSFCNICSDR